VFDPAFLDRRALGMQNVVLSALDILSIRTEEIRSGAGYDQALAVLDDHIRALPA
jgi:hypothetical protein